MKTRKYFRFVFINLFLLNKEAREKKCTNLCSADKKKRCRWKSCTTAWVIVLAADRLFVELLRSRLIARTWNQLIYLMKTNYSSLLSSTRVGNFTSGFLGSLPSWMQMRIKSDDRVRASEDQRRRRVVLRRPHA